MTSPTSPASDPTMTAMRAASDPALYALRQIAASDAFGESSRKLAREALKEIDNKALSEMEAHPAPASQTPPADALIQEVVGELIRQGCLTHQNKSVAISIIASAFAPREHELVAERDKFKQLADDV